jgi:EmrB/QacA subfamily drug resistance transporter
MQRRRLKGDSMFSTRFSQKGTLAVVCLATAMLMLDIAVVNTALSHITDDLNASISGLQWVVDAYTLALATVVLTAGSVADRLGRRRIFAWGMVIFTATSLACAMAGSIEVLDVARAIQGIGAAMMFASSLAVLADAFPGTAERSKAFALCGATIGAAFAVGPLVGGALTSYVSWRAVFYINIPLGIAAVAAMYAWVRESYDPRPRKVDWLGQTTLIGAMFLLVLALLRANEDGWGSTAILAEVTGSAALFATFVWAERRSDEPMLPLQLFSKPDFTGAQVAAFGISASFFALFLYTTLYLQQILHLSPIETGLVYLPGTVLIFLVSGASASLTSKVPPSVLVVTGLMFVAAGLALFLLADETSDWTAVMPGVLVGCLGTGLFNPAVVAIALGSVPETQSGLAAGTNDAFRQGGIAVGVALFGAIVPAGAALGNGSPADYVSGMHNAALVGAGLAAVGALACSRLFRVGLASSGRRLARAAVAVATD